ncbi:MAG: diacylglycerol kinase family lipid kinase [Planctomycetia bacterium]|nr:diacylglycerol kinase family lipid kinase [Planctomycetia bacterium]
MADVKSALILMNPAAGSAEPDLVRAILSNALRQHGWEFSFYILEKGVVAASIVPVIQQATEQGTTLIIASGGDGTVSLVATAVILSGLKEQLRLGLFPAGTANSLAKELGMPAEWTEAAQFLASLEAFSYLDAMKMGERYCFLRIGIGLDAATIEATTPEAKRWLGRWAYLRTFLSRFFNPQRVKYHCVIDGRHRRFWAVQVFIANGGRIALAPFRIGPDIAYDDGLLNLCAYDALSGWDYFTVGWRLFRKRYDENPLLKFWTIRNSITVSAKRALPVQGDGEPCGTTPVTITVLPQALRVVATKV